MSRRKSRNKFYVVWHGHEPGIYDSWAACEASIRGISNARYKGFPTREAAEKALLDGSAEHWGTGKPPSLPDPERSTAAGRPVMPSLCVDVAWNAVTKVMEYRGVWLPDGSIAFEHAPIERGTNNIGEFLAVVHALGLLKRKLLDCPVYTDSMTAMSWLRRRRVASTSLQGGRTSPQVNNLVRRALKWLEANDFTNPVLKWNTESWGQIPADYGRK